MTRPVLGGSAGQDSAPPHAALAGLEPPSVPGLQVIRLLGLGGRAAVWQVQRATGWRTAGSWVSTRGTPPQTLALKCPVKQPRSAPSLRSGRQELEALRHLDHPHVIRAWGVVEWGPMTAVALDACAAGSLAQYLRTSGTLSIGELVTTLSPIASAVDHLHHHGAAHGDITAANILLHTDGSPVLSDLADAAVLGLPAVVATPADDVQALARIAWYALTGAEPGPTAQRPPLAALRPEVPMSLGDLLEDSLNENPDQRPTAGEFALELFDTAAPKSLNLVSAVDDEALCEIPTVLPEGAPHRHRGFRWGAGPLATLRRVLGSWTGRRQ